MARYNQPTKGSTNWDEPLNENFANLGIEVTDEVATFADLPAPTGATSSNGISRRVLVLDEGAIYRDAGSRWEPVLTSGGSSSSSGVTVVDGTTVSDINAALRNSHCVHLKPGQTYTNDGSETVEFPGGSNKTVLAYGAEIEVASNPTVLFKEGGVGGNEDGWSRWHGGVFTGNQNAGDIAFQAVDNIFGVIDPHVIRDCETAVALTNDDLWCEFMTVDYWGLRNEVGTMLLGGNGNPPSGSNVSRPNGGSGSSPSFRHLYLRAYDQLRNSSSALNTRYGIFMEDASPYTGRIDYTVSAGVGEVGWRYHGRMNGNNVYYHAENPRGKPNGGIGFKVDKNTRWSAMARMRIGGGFDDRVQNNTNEPVTYWDCVQEPNTAYGSRLMRDGSPMISFRNESGTHVMDCSGIDAIRLANNSELS